MVKKRIIKLSRILGVLVLIAGSIILIKPWEIFIVGSYPYAEYYTFETYSKESLIKRIDILKRDNPEYKLMKMSYNGELEEVMGSDSESGYNLYFYFSDIDMTVHCIIKKGAGNPTRLGLTACSPGVNFSNWKDINKDLSKDENAKIKKKFEAEILNKLGGWSKK